MGDEERELGAVFKALGDPTRRRLLDRLREHDGQTLGQLCTGLEMARQSATQHLDILIDAGLVTVVRRGRERHHYLNPVPIHEIEERWVSRFDRPRLQSLISIKNQAEELAMTELSTSIPATSIPTTPIPSYVYVTYIRAGAEQVWHALTDADLTARYWGHSNVSNWQQGSSWEHRRTDGSGIVDVGGTVIEAKRPNRLVITFGAPDKPAGEQSVVTFLVEPHNDIVRLTVTHTKLADQTALDQISHGWPAVIANLKSLLETGDALPQAPWEMQPIA